MAAKRFRMQHIFWLNMNKAEEYDLAETIEDLKQKRLFSDVVRKGIRLMVDLLQGNLDVLCELFPDIEAQFHERFMAKQESDEPAMMGQLRRIEALLGAEGRSESFKTNSMPRAIDTPQRVAPDTEDTPALVIKKSEKDDSAQNFLNTLMALQGN